VAFKLKTPETCLTDALCVVCYAEDNEGCEELQFLYSRSDDGEINYEDFCKFSNHLQVGLDLILDEIEMFAIESILETVFVPDFVLIDLNQNSFRSWKRCQKFLEDNNVLICGSSFPMSRSLSDEEVLEDFDFLGDKAYVYVIENPWKIADRISGNYKFDVSLIEEIEEGVKAAVSALQFNNNPIHRQVKHETYSSLMRFVKTIEKKYTEEEK
jgi:hypothetical protein